MISLFNVGVGLNWCVRPARPGFRPGLQFLRKVAHHLVEGVEVLLNYVQILLLLLQKVLFVLHIYLDLLHPMYLLCLTLKIVISDDFNDCGYYARLYYF